MKLKILLSLLAAAIASLFLFRGCNSTEVVIEDTEETIKVKQLMNEIVQQQQQRDLGGAAPPQPPAAE